MRMRTTRHRRRQLCRRRRRRTPSASTSRACSARRSAPPVQGALNAASANPGPDVVRIGARAEPYEGPFTYDEYAFNPVQIIGDGVGATVPAATSPRARPATRQGRIEGRGRHAAPPPGETQSQSAGFELDGADAENVEVRDTGQQSGAVGVLTKADADIRNLVVDMSAGLAVSAGGRPAGHDHPRCDTVRNQRG